MIQRMNRRRILKGMLQGGAVSVGLPIFDCLLNTAGTAFADGAPLPACLGTWFWGLGLTPGRWVPAKTGADYQLGPEMDALTPLKHKINVYSGLDCFLDGRPNQVHQSGQRIFLNGGIPRGQDDLPSIDVLVGDRIGSATRFRSLEVNCIGNAASFSRRSGSSQNPSETSPAALYARVFGSEFADPNAADFKPDPKAMVRHSVLSAITEERTDLANKLGAADRAKLDEYFTSLRELEKQLEVELEKPAPLAACTIPAKDDADAPANTVIDNAFANQRLFGRVLAHALACGQTRVVNVVFSPGGSSLRMPGDSMTLHTYSHEEAIDPKLGYQAVVAKFQASQMRAFFEVLSILDGFREGASTLLDRMVILASSDVSYARFHTIENMPILTAGGAGGRLKTGLHVQAKGDPVTRVGLTLQQALGVPVNSWGLDSNQTSKTLTEILV